MPKKMLIDATHPEETRVVVMDGTKIDEFDFESLNKRQLAGNIYLAKVTRVEPSLQAAFVEYGGNRHGFLAFSEIHPDYYQIPVADREALLAAEAAVESAGDDDEPKETKKPRARRSRSRKKTAEAAAPEAEATPVEGAAEGDAESDIAAGGPADGDAAPDADSGHEAVAAPENASGEADGAGDAEAVAEAAPSDGPSDGPNADVKADATTDESAETTAEDAAAAPKSIAESAGADEGDSVSEPLADEAPERARTATETAAADDTATENVAESVAEAAPESAKAEAGPEAASDARSSDNGGGDGGGGDGGGDDGEKPKSRRARGRGRSRAKKPRAQDAEAGAEAKTGDNGGDGGGDNGGASDEGQVESAGADRIEDEVRPRRVNHRRYKIQEVVKVRQIMLVQVVKEERGNKGAALTTYLSLAGRYCVLMPNTARGGGISRKITQASDRKKLKEIAGELEVPKGMGLIIRTAGAQRTKTEIKRDYEFLLRQWEQIRDLTLKSVAPALIYEEGSLIKRSIRDLYGRDIDSILVEGEDAYREAKDYMKMLMPSHAKNVQPYKEATPLFAKFGAETHLAAMFNPTVQLKSGGYIVIGITEALVAIDVNSGRSTREHSIEETALKTNLEASDEVARQLRLRDLAGLIVIDYIDMDENRNNRAVEKRMKDRLKDDRARIQVGRISAFGLMEMSRQRLRPGMLEATTSPCAHCHGTGLVRSADNVSLAILREVEEEGVRRRVRALKVSAPVEIANYLMNAKRAHIASIEERYGVDVQVEGDPKLISPDYSVEKLKGDARPPRREEPRTVSAETAFEQAEAEEESEAPARPDAAAEDGDADGSTKRRRRGKRGGRRRRKGETVAALDGEGDAPGEAVDGGPLGDVIDSGEGGGDDNIVETTEETAQKPKRKRPARRRKTDADGEASEGAVVEDVESNSAPASVEVVAAPVEATEAEATPIEEVVAETVVAEAEVAEPTPIEAETEATEAAEDLATQVEGPIVAEEPVAEEPTDEPVAEEIVPEDAIVAEEHAPAPEKPKKKRSGWWS